MPEAVVDLSRVYQPHPGQWTVHESDAKIKVLRVARRWGKSRCSLFELLKRFTESLDTPVSQAKVPPFHAWIICPSFPQARQTWNELVQFVPPEMIQDYPAGIHSDEQIIYLEGNENRKWGMIEIKSGHLPEYLQTVGLDFLWIQEAQDIPNEAFEKVHPTLQSPEAMGYGLFEGIPSLWPEHWFQRVYAVADSDRRDDWFAYTGTYMENPFLSKEQREEIELAREFMPEAAWRRMYLAEFSSDAGFFRHVDACIRNDPLPGPIMGNRYVGGLDLGRKRDASVFCVMDAQSRRLVHVTAWDAGEDWRTQKAGFESLSNIWRLERLIVDATGMGGDVLVEELTNMSLPIEPYVIGTKVARDYLLNQLAVSFEKETVAITNHEVLLRQLRAFQYRKTQGGLYKAEAPPGEHDDHVFGLALALEACDEAPQDGGGFRITPLRYLPTQAEANAGGISYSAQKVRRRHVDKMRTRQDAVLGVE